MHTVRSFDIFDTVIVRRQARPTDLFGFLGSELKKKGLIKCEAEHFLRLRRDAELKARRSTACGEVTLVEIYHCLAPYLGWNYDDSAAALKDELACELKSWT